MMKMFRNELLDLKEILEYIKMQPSEDATSSTVWPAKLFGTTGYLTFVCATSCATVA